MDYRCRLPGALVRRATQWAADHDTDLSTVIRRLLALVVEDRIDPLAPDPIASATASRGGHARAARLTQAERRSSAQRAANARWDRHDPSP